MGKKNNGNGNTRNKSTQDKSKSNDVIDGNTLDDSVSVIGAITEAHNVIYNADETMFGHLFDNTQSKSNKLKRKLSTVSDSESESDSVKTTKQQKRTKNLQATVSGSVSNVIAEAEVHMDSSISPDVRVLSQMISTLSHDMRNMFGDMNTRINDLERNLELRSEVNAVVDSLRLDIDEDLQVIEKKLEDFSNQITNQSTSNIDCNLVIRNLPESTNENIVSKVSALFREGLKVQITPINCERKQSRSTHTSGVVIVSCKSKAVVNDVMSAKYKLKSSRQYSDVFIHRDQTVQQRIERKNFQTIVDVLKSVDPHINMKGAEVIASRFVNSKRSSENRNEHESRGTSHTQQNTSRRGTNNSTRSNTSNLHSNTGHSNYNARTSHREQNNGHSSRNHHQQSRKENSTRQIDKDTFFDTLITQVYEHQNKGPFFICGDFNSRCGNESDYIEGVDNLCQRNVIDFKCNSYCNAFIDFLISAYCCILNGRNFVNNDYTFVSTKGCSVVDYCIVPYDNLNLFKDFCVIRANDLVTSTGFDVNGVDLKLIPDHSLIKWSIDLNAFMSNVQPTNDKDETFSTKFEKFDFNKIPANFMNTNNVYQNICSLIESLKTVEHQQNCVNGIYDDYCKTVESEMSDKIPSKTIFVGGKQSNKKYRNRKPWWNESLSKLWYEMCNAEKAWNKCKNMHQNQLKAIYVQKRKHFDSEVQKSKRKYWYDMQEQLLSESSKNQHMFWKKIGKIGIAESRKHVIPMEVIDDDGNVSSELTDVLDKWKSEYSELLNQQNSSIRVSDSCTSLNEASTFDDFLLTEPISYQETVHVIEKTKRGKSAGIDNLPGEKYREIIDEQERRGFIEKIGENTVTSNRVHYIPHHAVKKESSTSLIWIVFDCSCRARQETPSLNDCLMDTAPDLNEANYYTSRTLFAKAGFNLRSWASNNKTLKDRATSENVLDNDKLIKVIRLRWNTDKDTLTFAKQEYVEMEDHLITKREILRQSSKKLRPSRNYISPITVRSKMFMQTLWRKKLDWDEPLSPETIMEWKEIQRDTHECIETEISRPYFKERRSTEDISLHIFTDASLKALWSMCICSLREPVYADYV
ncbi:Hypothetical predicted protein [Mytilus galloprovincialis]|uniref:Endonuclease/exonuclease/phosphatase domain-containing protein n=1 Tax=Mytilus galloprovincialis TaxID=29158 RepID=A0A8B6DCX2_MYTGA|nr:Hypothetical predicted protein [Mytilus galloprovincialis]